ncbi:Ig-like domain-containing protein [Brucepastera parasyntrophica]|uniref:Ig-like domain-containing protein n=1 Tax=Brucepastera parasyntrophica TaxID=2880008 RepID=UPI003F70C956
MVTGYAVDDDGIAEVWYSFDKGVPVQLESSGVFCITNHALSGGTHTVEIWPVDIHGVRGDTVSRTFNVTGTVPLITVNAIGDSYSSVDPEAGQVFTASVFSDAGLKSVSYKVGDGAETPVTVRSGSRDASISIPVAANMPYGLVSVEITATDIFDRVTEKKTSFHVRNLHIPHGSPPEWSSDTLKVSAPVTLSDSSSGTASVSLERLLPRDIPFSNGAMVTLAGPNAPREKRIDGSIVLSIDTPIQINEILWSINGSPDSKISARRIDSSSSLYEASIPLSATLPAGWTTVTATITLKDLTKLTVSGGFAVIRPIPDAGINDDEQFVWNVLQSTAGSISIIGTDGVSGFYNAKNDRTAASVRFEQNITGMQAVLEGNTVRITGVTDGEYKGVALIITDDAGAAFRTQPVDFFVNSLDPTLIIESWERPVWLQDVLPIRGSASDGLGIASVDYSFNRGETWVPLSGANFNQRIDITALPDGPLELHVRATNRAGRSTTNIYMFIKDTTPPVVEVVLPEPGDVVNGKTLMAFRFLDDHPVVSAYYHKPGEDSNPSLWIPLELSSMTNCYVGTPTMPILDNMVFRFKDAAGNETVMSEYFFTIDSAGDLPVVEIHLPEENEIIRKDFVISGVVYDDDQAAKIFYKIDNAAYTEVEIEHSFSIPIKLSSLTDNEHIITMYAEDIYGVRGEEVQRTIRVSLEEPKAEVLSPTYETTTRGVVSILGTASDKNGIDKVEVSLDNGNTFNLATGAEMWEYRFDSRVIQDGTHVVFVRVYDKYETTGLYSSLINIDNTAPHIQLELPLDGGRVADALFVSGQALDNISLERVTARISNLDSRQPAVSANLSEIEIESDIIISRVIDITTLPEGFYNMELRGYDRAGNITRVSRNFEVNRGPDRNRIDFLYPLNGENVQGVFNLYGRVVSEDPVNNLLLYVDGVDVAAAEVTSSGYFKFTVGPEMIADGLHSLLVKALIAGERVINSEERAVNYKANGPWITIDNFTMGDFAIERPWLMGTTGYSFTEEEIIALNSKETTKTEKAELQRKSLNKVEISFDNGKTFLKTESGKKWRYRIETGDMDEGYHFMIVRATMNNGEVAITRSIIQIDKTKPSIMLIAPSEGGRYNNELEFSGLSSDDVKLDSVVLSLRAGDKSRYAIPSFIQGLYFDWHVWGGTLYDIGVGLTFFDNNVKVQAQFGQFTTRQRELFTDANMRYGGNVFGFKLLANVGYIPMDFFFGPDLSWLSATIAIGANFSIFTESQSGQPQILSAVLAQLEFPRVTLPKRTTFRIFSFYTEFQLWFIPTDVNVTEVDINSLLPHISFGIRMNVF